MSLFPTDEEGLVHDWPASNLSSCRGGLVKVQWSAKLIEERVALLSKPFSPMFKPFWELLYRCFREIRGNELLVLSRNPTGPAF